MPSWARPLLSAPALEREADEVAGWGARPRWWWEDRRRVGRQLHGGRSGAVIRVKAPGNSAQSVTKALGQWRTAWTLPGFTLLVPTGLRASRNRTTCPPAERALAAWLSTLSNSESSGASRMGE